ncbi:MAG: LCP family protein [Anaerolineaceae bacterium]
MKKSKKGLGISILLLALGALGVALILVWNSPLLGRTLPTSETDLTLQTHVSPDITLHQTEIPITEETVEAAKIVESAGILSVEDMDSSLEQAESLKKVGGTPPKPVCSGPETMPILVLGIDNNEQADAIRLMRIDFVNEKISILSIPRDFYVPIADMSMHNIDTGRINATYGYGEYFNGAGGGVVSLATNLDYNFGVTFDHYLVLHLEEIAKYIDMIGGVDIVLDQPVADGNSYFNAGPHHLDGEMAVRFMRMRYYDSDFQRVRRQSQVLTAFYKKTMDELNWMQIIKMSIDILSDESISTDFAIKDIYTLVCLARRIESSDVNFVEIPSDMYHAATTTLGAAVQIPHDTVPAFIQSVMDGSYQPE